MKILKAVYPYVVIFCIYFSLCAFVITCSFLLFLKNLDIVFDAEQLTHAAKSTFINIIILAGLLVLIDTIRRKITVERPVKQINEALRKMMTGDFSIRLNPQYSQNVFAEIMKNINLAAKELSGVETLRSDFIANVSHEMKTPLAVMQNYGTLLGTPGLSEDKRTEYAKAVTDSCKRLADLMTNILKLNRLENQQIYPQKTTYNLSEQLCTCLLAYENVWEQSQIEIETDIAEDVFITADTELLSLVWNNLFSNAFKFTPDGGKVSVSLTAGDYYAVVRISDTGCGMTPETGAHIFEKFYQGDTSHATAGNGLGLALVKRIMDITGSEISVTSTLGVGSIFTVQLRRQ